MRVLITGAGGFVGRHIVDALHQRGADVWAADLAFDADLRSRWGSSIHLIESDLLSLPSLPVNAVVHAAALTASPDEAGQTPEANLRANLDPLLNVLEWASKVNAQRVIVISSDAVYRHSTATLIDEAQPVSPLGTYATAKALAEHFAATLKALHGRDVVAVRLGAVYGAGEHARASRPRLSLITRLAVEAVTTGVMRLQRPDEARDWTFAADVGAAVAELLAAPTLEHALYNVVSGQVATPRQIAQIIQPVVPTAQIEIDTDAAFPALTRRGILSNQRLMTAFPALRWTPLVDGVRQVVNSLRVHEAAS